MNKTTVVNIYHDKYDVYIGRAGKGQDGTFGNPYFRESREDNIKLFKEYFYNRIKNDKFFAQKILNLRGKCLGCFCAPVKRCHGDIIAEYLNNLQEEKSLKMAVVGSRSFCDYDYMKKILKWYEISMIISGGDDGADCLAKRYAKENGIEYQEFPAEWDRYGRAAGPIRNKHICNAANEVICFYDGSSKGTAHTIKIAKEQGKPVHIYTFLPKE